jgi:HAD superfamily hydrolase (TIGR01458 family)
LGFGILAGVEFLKAVQGFLIDLDGVIYTGDKPVPGADTAIRSLEENGYSYRFVSNTTRKSRHTLAEKLSRMGLQIPEEDIFTPSVAATAYLKKTGKRRFRLLVTGDVSRDFPLEEPGTVDDSKDCVILGDAGDEITYNSLNIVFRDLMEGAELIALEKDRYWMAPEGLSLSAGPFITALEFATGKKAILIGKPSKTFFDLALKDMGLCHDQVAMIGDDIQTDIGGAQEAGMRGILVKTGKYREDSIRKISIRPDLMIDSIADISKVLEAVQKNRWDRSI